MDDDQARNFWERALREIEDGGFFAPVQTAEPLASAAAPEPARRKARRRPTNVQLVAIVVLISLVLALAVVSWLTPALF